LTQLQILPLGMWAALFAAMLVINSMLATGQELGWRGYMVPRMVEAGANRQLLVSSLVWGVWHIPLFLWGDLVHDGPNPLITTGLLMVSTMALGYVLGRLRLDSGNVWPGRPAPRKRWRLRAARRTVTGTGWSGY
jgi:membrane protease YdiL (CAAX protease family)